MTFDAIQITIMSHNMTATLSFDAKRQYLLSKYDALSKLSKETILNIGVIGNENLSAVIVGPDRKFGVKRNHDKTGRITYNIVVPSLIHKQYMDSFLFAALMFIEACRFKGVEHLIPRLNLDAWKTLRSKSLENFKTINNNK